MWIVLKKDINFRLNLICENFYIFANWSLVLGTILICYSSKDYLEFCFIIK